MLSEILERKEVSTHGDIAKILLGNQYNIDNYKDFMFLKQYLPTYDFGYDDEEPFLTTDKINLNIHDFDADFSSLSAHLFDYQKYFVKVSLLKKKFALFLDTGLGKTSIELEIAAQLARNGLKSLIVCPLMVLSQFELELSKFYSGLEVYNLRNGTLEDFINSDIKIGLINIEFFKHQRELFGVSGFILDESGILKSENGVFGKNIIASCNKAGIDYRIAGSATPAPNDYAELANHALFLGKIKTYSQFFGDWFQKDFKDQTKWVLRPHAKQKFYEYLASWSILMRHPKKFGFEDNTESPPDYRLSIKKLSLEKSQIESVKSHILAAKFNIKKDQQSFFSEEENLDIDSIPKGITIRNKLAQISRGFFYKTVKKKRTVIRCESNKPEYVYQKCYVEFPHHQFLIWVELDEEEEILKEHFGNEIDFEIINGKTKLEDKARLINSFINGETRILITKPRIAGFGLNLQHVNKMIYYGISDSYEKFYQSLRRCYRRGQTKHLDVFIPITELEKPIMDNVNLKSDAWEKLIDEQERYFIGIEKNEFQRSP